MMFDQALVQEIHNHDFSKKPLLSHLFTMTLSNKKYQETEVLLFKDHIIFRINTGKDYICLKMNFNFDLIFDLERNEDQKSRVKLGHPHTLKFQRYNQSLELNNSNQHEVMFQWRDHLSRLLNQRGFHQLFRPIKKVGKGNFATVYLASKHQDGQKYAVKAFSKQGTYSQQKGKQSLVNQIQVMRKFDHKNLMQLYEIFQSQNSIYIIVQLLEGGQLYDKIKNKYKFSPEQIVSVMKGITLGLEAMHAKNIMHRDLKPENILLRKDGDFDVVIADFGLASDADVKEYLFVRCGTPGYVAPEIVNLKDLKAKYTTQCDMFSLGVIFHLLLLRKSPFPGRQYDEVLSQNRACKFDFQSAQYKKISAPALDLMKKLLQKDPKKRITAKDALKHQYFAKDKDIQEITEVSSPIESTIPSRVLRERPSPILIQKQSVVSECDSPLMLTKNQSRKQGRLREDSCLKFKMKENINMTQNGQTIQEIHSPANIPKKTPKTQQSRFKKMVQNESN